MVGPSTYIRLMTPSGKPASRQISQSRNAVIGVSMAVFSLYYVGLIAGETAAKADYLPPFVAMWSSNIIFTLAGLALLARAGR